MDERKPAEVPSLTKAHLRIARPTDRLAEVVAFYRDGLGFEVLFEFEDHDGFDGVMLGHRDAPYHLEFTRRAGHKAGRAPSEDNLLVFYLPDEAQWSASVARLEATGNKIVQASNPYWDRRGKTFEDPDGYRVVLQHDSWLAAPAQPLAWPAWIGVVCENLEAQRVFYRDLLELREIKAGDQFVMFDVDGRLLELLALSPLPQCDRRRITFGFEVGDIHIARAALIARGVTPETEVAGGPEFHQYWAYFKDAEGNLFEIVQRLSR